MYGIRGYVWLVGQGRPVYVQGKGEFTTKEDALARIDAVENMFTLYQTSLNKERTITVCNTVFKLESVQAIQLQTYVPNRDKLPGPADVSQYHLQ